MPVEQVPGFWDYLGKGVDQGIERQREDVKNKQQQDQFNATLAAQLFGAGALKSGALQGSIRQAGGSGTGVIASKAEKRKKALETPGAIDAMTDEQRADVGFQTRTEKKVDAAAGMTADFTAKRATAMLAFANGEKLDDVGAQLTGFSTKEDKELERLGKMDPFLDHVGERFVAGAINQNPNGKIASGQAKQIAEKAYADYVANRAQSGLGNLTPEETTYTRSYFDRATQNAIIAQTKLDIDSEDARSRRIHANAAGATAGQNQGMQWFKTLNTSVDILRKKQDDLLKANPAIAYAQANPNLAVSPMIAGALAEYNTAGQKIDAYRGAQSTLGQGSVPPNMNELLAAANADVAPPKGVPGGAPAGGQIPDAAGMAVNALVTGQGSIAQLQEAVKAGVFTQDQYMTIIQKAAAAKKGKK